MPLHRAVALLKNLYRQPHRITLAAAAATILVVGMVAAALTVGTPQPVAGPVFSATGQQSLVSDTAARVGAGSGRNFAAFGAVPEPPSIGVGGAAGHHRPPPGRHAETVTKAKPDIPARAAGRAAAAARAKAAAKAKAEASAKAKAEASAKAAAKAKAEASAKAAAKANTSPLDTTHQMWDSTTPGKLPGNSDVAVYSDGQYYATRSQVKRFQHVLWIDVSGANPHAQALDVEPGDVTPAQAPAWVTAHVNYYGPKALSRLYTFKHWWPQLRRAVDKLPARYRDTVRYWIADPTGKPHVLPGSAATQWDWTSARDVSTVTPRFNH